MPITLTGEVLRVTYENEATGFRVLKLGGIKGPVRYSEPLAVVGVFQAVGPGTRVRVTGRVERDGKHGEQLRVETLVPILPETVVALEKYLGSGIIPGIGPGLAKRIVTTFGMSALDILDNAPERLGQVPGLGQRRIEDVKRAWVEKRALSSIMLLLQAHGASPALARRIWDRYGERSASVVQQSPFRLALDVRGIGFKTADRIARSLGISGDHPERAQAGVWHCLGVRAEAGHTWGERGALVAETAAMLEIDEAHVDAAVDVLWASQRIVVEAGHVGSAVLQAAEATIATGIQRLVASPGERLLGVQGAIRLFEEKLGVSLAPKQREAVQAAADNKVVVITGGPGVGKTTIIRAIISVLLRARLRIRLAAPTGRAARRLSEATSLDAVTLHRLLEFEPRTGRFLRSTSNPIEADAIIVDEASMMDVQLGAALVSALPAAARWIVVGDSDQLPSVGPGAVLRDLIDSRQVVCVKLDEIFRQSENSHIVENAHRILRGEAPCGSAIDEPGADFFVIPREDPEPAAATICKLVTERVPQRFGFDPFEDIQVLCPMHRGAAGTSSLNARLQALLNPTGDSLESRGQLLRVADKVMQTRNDYEKGVFNGDVGRILSVDSEARSLQIKVDERIVAYGDADLEALTLAYAVTVHKSQGSEYPVVVMPLLSQHFMMLSRNLLYTAVTRAKKLCVLVAHPKAIRIALAETRREQRHTRLAELLRD